MTTGKALYGKEVARTAFAMLAAVACVAAQATSGTFADDVDYLRRKWREDVSDRSTGASGAELRKELEAMLSAWKKEMPWQMAKAKAFAHLCDRTAIGISEHDWFPAFAYWTRFTFETHPLWKLLEKRRDEVVAARSPDLLRRRKWDGRWWGYHDYDHSAPDWDVIVRLGFKGMAERLEKSAKDTDYYRARRIAMAGVFRLLDRMITYGEGKKAAGGRVARVVESLKRLRSGAPETALDALNFIYLYWVMSENFEGIQVRTLGNLDRIIAPFYRADVAAGRTDECEFRDQFRHFWWQWGSLDNYWGQPVYFGGTEADGSSVYGEMSRIMLDVHDELALPTPKLHLKMGPSTPEWVWRKTLEMMRRQRSITFIGEEPHARVIKSLGYTDEQAREFMIWGCYEWAIRDSANDTTAAQVNLLKPVERLLSAAAAGKFGAADFGTFKDSYMKEIEDTVAEARDFAFDNEKLLEDINPSMLFSIATAYSVETGRDAFSGGTRNGNNSAIWMVGAGTSVDALLAVKDIVYDRREMSLSDLGRLMASDWAGAEGLRLRMLRSKMKWGNNCPEANALGKELVKRCSAQVTGRPNSRGGVFKASGHSARWHITFGQQTGATPDGRKKGEEMSKNISPTMGADTEGATALVCTAASLDACDLPGDFPLDVGLLPSSVTGEKGLAAMRTLIENYFGNGGLVIQFNVVDAATLRAAQRNPEKYANLQVRVCGWNVRWNDIPPVEQEKFIIRAENLAH